VIKTSRSAVTGCFRDDWILSWTVQDRFWWYG